MIFITGGAWQGKLSFARTLAAGRNGQPLETAALLVSDGRKDKLETAFERPIINGFHYFVKHLLEEGKSVGDFIIELEEKNPDVVITADELGCGIVPVDPEERAWREAAGRAAQRLAADSGEVYRMVCGIATRLK